jgi:phage terminase large subunit-like protein
MEGYLLEDATTTGGPKKWAEAAVSAYQRHKADVLVAEANNGGEMVAITINTVDNSPSVKLVHASRGKITRAEPVQKLCFDGRIHHMGHFSLLEHELTHYRPLSGMPSPGRLDAYTWLWTELLLGTSNTAQSLGEAAKSTMSSGEVYSKMGDIGGSNW